MLYGVKDYMKRWVATVRAAVFVWSGSWIRIWVYEDRELMVLLATKRRKRLYEVGW